MKGMKQNRILTCQLYYKYISCIYKLNYNTANMKIYHQYLFASLEKKCTRKYPAYECKKILYSFSPQNVAFQNVWMNVEKSFLLGLKRLFLVDDIE